MDLEETGYQASFSRLGASEVNRADPLAEVQDPGTYMARALAACSKANPGRIGPLVQAVPQDLAQSFLSLATSEGLQFS